MSVDMNYRPSKRFTRAMLCMCPLAVALYCGLVPELKNIESAPVPGEIVFRQERPPRVSKDAASSKPGPSRHSSWGIWDWTTDWLSGQFDTLMTWERNPWKREKRGFGDHFMELCSSKDPAVKAKVKEIRRLGEALFQRVLARYP